MAGLRRSFGRFIVDLVLDHDVEARPMEADGAGVSGMSLLVC